MRALRIPGEVVLLLLVCYVWWLFSWIVWFPAAFSGPAGWVCMNCA